MEGMRFPSLVWQVLKGIWKARDRGKKKICGIGEIVEGCG